MVLNVLSPVIGYACAPGNQSPLSVERCHAAGAQHVVDLDGSHDRTTSAHFVVPHCVYCPGFAAANFALGASASVVAPPVRTLAYARAVEPEAVFVRRSVRIAQPRGPPVPLI